MKTLEQIRNYSPEALDGRDVKRLIPFLTEAQCKEFFDIEFKDEYKGKEREVKEWTRENIIEELKGDVEFGFDKALDQRGLSAGAMFNVVSMWNWILEEGLENYDQDNGYAQYGLPLFKATAVKYGFDNPIGDDEGNERTYAVSN